MNPSRDEFAALYWSEHYNELPALEPRERVFRQMSGLDFDQDNRPPSSHPAYSDDDMRTIQTWHEQVFSVCKPGYAVDDNRWRLSSELSIMFYVSRKFSTQSVTEPTFAPDSWHSNSLLSDSIPPDDIDLALNGLDTNQNPSIVYHSPRHPSSRQPDIYWLDLSQFNMNPYLEVLFGDRLSVKQGKYEINLRSSVSSSDLLFEPHLPLSVLSLLDQITHDEEGIRLGPLLRALEKHSANVTESWIEQTERLKAEVKRGYWLGEAIG
ncbi:hypothetical protein K458DRAFT_396466 [Lentithecium fluviatile CBS 122367]|uniref:Uncharacterized protein n=1 Tax=Lentithecium fluviatile CBS 122367 TaxID=1168545 RepID=A0A6G1IF76_9PLEO|nr:hypothetical protein K458DRAFT_396466 [Lentithecium fluviatile CBS 122367]